MRTEGINTNTATLNVHNLFCDFEKKTNPNSSIEKKKKKSPIQFRRAYNGNKGCFKEKERMHIDVCPLFILFSRQAGIVTRN